MLAVTGRGAGAVGDLLAPCEDTTLEQSEVTGYQLGGANCSSPEALIEDEGPHLVLTFRRWTRSSCPVRHTT